MCSPFGSDVTIIILTIHDLASILTGKKSTVRWLWEIHLTSMKIDNCTSCLQALLAVCGGVTAALWGAQLSHMSSDVPPNQRSQKQGHGYVYCHTLHPMWRLSCHGKQTALVQVYQVDLLHEKWSYWFRKSRCNADFCHTLWWLISY